MATEHTIDMIRDRKRTMLETEDIGVSLLQDLHQQRGRLIHAHDILHNVDDNIGKSRRIIGAMVRRMDRNKWIIGFIIALLVLAILVILKFCGIIIVASPPDWTRNTRSTVEEGGRPPFRRTAGGHLISASSSLPYMYWTRRFRRGFLSPRTELVGFLGGALEELKDEAAVQ
uniref:t-SNARE coiled-coil homology domain-containing protein n=1 Tax=Oryza nivara TaxID=4536 RepID=A0A0E0FN80_ORYNI